jgi:SH3-like domain-containing protein
MKSKNSLLSLIAIIVLILISLNTDWVAAQEIQQQPTVAIPTVTGTPEGVTITVPLDQEYVNVRNGPGTLYDLVGRLVAGQKAAVLGRSEGGDWLLIRYFGGPDNQGWVYTAPVSLSAGEVPIVEPPPTLTPEMTQTINPTLAAQFITTPIPTRLVTFTPVESLVVPTYEDVASSSFLGSIPMGLMIIILGGLGMILALVSVIRSR